MLRLFGLVALLVALLPQAIAGQSAPPDERRVSLSGYLQPQYESHTRDSETTDRAHFRRLVVGLEATVSNAWAVEFQVDAGPIASGDDDRLTVKDAHLQYRGWEDHGILLTIGNQKLPFSRALLGSSSRRGLVERPVTGDRSLGSPGRALAIRTEGWHRRRTLYWSAAVASSRQSPDADEIRVDGITEADEGWNQGPLVGGRVEVHPLGEIPRAHGDFDRGPLRFTLAAGAYGWWNDHDVEQGPDRADAERVTGFEMSGALRARGLSVDAEFEHIVSRAVDPRLDRGLYSAGRAALDKASLEAGYMLVPRRLEALFGFDIADAAVFAEPVRRPSGGVNVYVRGHSLKFSLMHRETFNERGTRGVRSRTTYVQAQFSF